MPDELKEIETGEQPVPQDPTAGRSAVPISELKVGHVLTGDVLTTDGRVLLAAGKEITDKLIANLQTIGIEQVLVAGKEYQALPEQAPPRDDRFFTKDRLRMLETIGAQDMIEPGLVSQSIDFARQLVSEVATGQRISTRETMLFTRRLTSGLETMSRPAAKIAEFSFQEYTIRHMINASAVFYLLARRILRDNMEAHRLAALAFLADLGKVKLPENILDRPGDLSREEMDLVKLHNLHSMRMISDREDLSDEGVAVVVQHHERLDGSGYPVGLKGSDIALTGRIMAVADTFDAITSERVYRGRRSPQRAISLLVKEAGVKFDRDVVSALIEVFGYYPVGTLVELNSGEIGVVSDLNAGAPMKPVVASFFDEHKRRLLKPKIRDLTLYDELYITRVIDG